MKPHHTPETYAQGLQLTSPLNAATMVKSEASNQASFTEAIAVNQEAADDPEGHQETTLVATEFLPADIAETPINQTTCPVKPVMRYRLLTSDELYMLPGFEWRIKGVLPATGLAAIFGQSGSGKSFLVLDMLHSLALGHTWFGHKVKQCSTTYIALEGETGITQRVKAYEIRRGEIPENVRYVTQSFNLNDADDLNDLASAIIAAGTGDVVVLDTLNRATPGTDENDSKAMGTIIANAKILQELTGGLVLLVHHTGKDQNKGMRGHSSLHAALDCAIEVKGNGDHRAWNVVKSKDGEDSGSHSFQLEIVQTGTDCDGDPTASCVVTENQSVFDSGNKSTPLGSNQRIALTALKPHLTKAIEIDGDTKGNPSVSFEQAIEIITPLMPVAPKHKKQRANEAIKGLVNHNILVMSANSLSMG